MFVSFRRCHRQPKVNSCCIEAAQVRSQVAHLEAARPIPSQNGVAPAAVARTEGERANRILHGVTEPVDLLADGGFQKGM